MRHVSTCRSLCAGTALALTLSLAQPASADNTPSAESLTDPEIGPPQNEQAAALGTYDTIVVLPDNLDYATAAAGKLALPFHVETKTTKKKWTVMESFVIVGLAPITSAGVVGACCGDLDKDDISANAFPVAVPHASSSHHVDKDAWWTMPNIAPSVGTRARNACRQERARLEQQGMDHDEIFGEDRHVTISYEFRYVAAVAYTKATGPNQVFWKQSQPSYRNVNVICQQRNGLKITRNPDVQPAGNGFVVPFQVSQAALATTVKDHQGACPAELHLNPTIETNGPGVVKYRFRDHLGTASPIYEASFAKADIKFLDHVVEVDTPKNVSGGLTTAPKPAGELGLKAPTDPNLVQGYYQLEIVSPQKKLSNIADYSVACTVPAVEGGGFTAVILKPDLVIEEVQEIPALPNKLFVKVTNIGAGASSPTNMKALRAAPGTATVRGTLVPAMAAGQSQVVQAELGGALSSASSLQLRIDDPNRLKEMNEENNYFQVK